jgi:hypothetical protein
LFIEKSSGIAIAPAFPSEQMIASPPCGAPPLPLAVPLPVPPTEPLAVLPLAVLALPPAVLPLAALLPVLPLAAPPTPVAPEL